MLCIVVFSASVVLKYKTGTQNMLGFVVAVAGYVLTSVSMHGSEMCILAKMSRQNARFQNTVSS